MEKVGGRTSFNNDMVMKIKLLNDEEREVQAETFGVLDYMPEYLCFWKSNKDYPFYTIRKNSVLSVHITEKEPIDEEGMDDNS